ncbi:MAG: hypothetical protein JWQ41_2031, partial [Variovorax sp.]|nr:hypothetical protein [Variovorax sp.]
MAVGAAEESGFIKKIEHDLRLPF